MTIVTRARLGTLLMDLRVLLEAVSRGAPGSPACFIDFAYLRVCHHSRLLHILRHTLTEQTTPMAADFDGHIRGACAAMCATGEWDEVACLLAQRG